MRVIAIAVALTACTDTEVSETVSQVTGPKCPDGETIEGIDVSEYQGSVNWQAVRASGRVFGIARINVGDHRDPYFEGNWTGMHDAGLIRGAYQYYKPSYDATAQANLVVSAVG